MTTASGVVQDRPEHTPAPRRSAEVQDDRLTADDLGAPLGDGVTVVQFSSTFCAPCRATRRVLERAVATSDDVAHIELDVADHLDLGQRLDIRVTPTVLVLDAQGVVRGRAQGAPSLAQARAAIDAVRAR